MGRGGNPRDILLTGKSGLTREPVPEYEKAFPAVYSSYFEEPRPHKTDWYGLEYVIGLHLTEPDYTEPTKKLLGSIKNDLQIYRRSPVPKKVLNKCKKLLLSPEIDSGPKLTIGQTLRCFMLPEGEARIEDSKTVELSGQGYALEVFKNIVEDLKEGWTEWDIDSREYNAIQYLVDDEYFMRRKVFTSESPKPYTEYVPTVKLALVLPFFASDCADIVKELAK